MKRVVYLAGMAGLVPAAMGILTPAAHHPVASKVTRPGVKKVSLHHAIATDCIAGTPFSIPTEGNVQGHGWYTNHVTTDCIGTVYISLKFNKSFCKSAYLAISNGIGSITRNRKLCGIVGSEQPTNFDVRSSWSTPVFVCGYSTYLPRSRATCKELG
jgi:hypothetical protein